MTYYVRAPGTCGEFLQGSINGQSFLVTCPINRYSYALSNVKHPFSQHYCALQPKSALARQLVQRLLEIKIKIKLVHLYMYVLTLYKVKGWLQVLLIFL